MQIILDGCVNPDEYMDTHNESCPTKLTLLTAWHDAAEAYEKVVGEFTRQIGTVSQEEYENLSRAAETARERSVEAQTTLEAHVRKHGCNRDGGKVAA